MKKLFSIIFLMFFFFWHIAFALENHVEWADYIDVTVSPTRYELSGDPGTQTTKPIKIINSSEFPVTFNASIENCRAKDTTWTPDCSPQSDYVSANSQISNWILLSESSFTIPAKSERDINFTVWVPYQATPWTHFWAIFFSTGKNKWGVITTEKRIWVLVLYKVSWDVVTTWVVDSINVSVRSDWGGWGNSWDGIPDDILSQLKKTVFIAKTELASWIDDIVSNLTTPDTDKVKQEVALKEKEKNEKVQVNFDIGFVNSGNTHIKPQGKIVILDNGTALTKISQEIIRNQNDAIIWQKVVDYIPVNDEWWNVLPNSKRIFDQEWNGFPYEIINDQWEREIKYKTFSEYYSDQNMSKRQILMFWEQVKTREKTKNLTAQVSLSYDGDNWKQEDYNSAKNFSVTYTEQYIWYNWFVLLILSIFGVFIFWIFLLAKKRKKKEDDEIKRLKKRLKDQEKELDKIEDLVEEIPEKIIRRRKKVDTEEKAPTRRRKK